MSYDPTKGERTRLTRAFKQHYRKADPEVQKAARTILAGRWPRGWRANLPPLLKVARDLRRLLREGDVNTRAALKTSLEAIHRKYGRGDSVRRCQTCEEWIPEAEWGSHRNWHAQRRNAVKRLEQKLEATGSERSEADNSDGGGASSARRTEHKSAHEDISSVASANQTAEVDQGRATADHNDDDSDFPGFPFPSTDIYKLRRSILRGLEEVDWKNQGLLALSGYRVGRTKGEPRDRRRRILNFLFLKDDLRDVSDAEYAAEWGHPMSSTRLRKLAESLAAFTRNAKRRNDANMEQAIEEWEEDLDYLRKTFYERWGDFPWPTVAV